MKQQIISISLPPFPDFIEGDVQTFYKGQKHPNRRQLGYFDLIIVKKGVLFLTEHDEQYTIRENELFILLPDQHHYAWQPCNEETQFYWLHFYTTAKWEQADRPLRFTSVLPIPELHYHQRSYTMHLRKHMHVKDQTLLFGLMEEILESTVDQTIESVWKTEELFLRFLRTVENQGIYKDRLTQIAEEVQLYLEKHLDEEVTNQTISAHFHLHSNYIMRAMKAVFGKTALELLNDMRLEKAKQYLLHTDMSIQEIARTLGYRSDVYFSNRFKVFERVSPRNYRNQHRN